MTHWETVVKQWKDSLTSAWRLEVTKQKRLKKLVFWLFESGLQLDGIRSAWWGGGVGEGQNAFFKIAMKQYLGRLMVLYGGGGSECFIWDSREAKVKNLDDA